MLGSDLEKAHSVRPLDSVKESMALISSDDLWKIQPPSSPNEATPELHIVPLI